MNYQGFFITKKSMSVTLIINKTTVKEGNDLFNDAFNIK